MWEWEKTQSLPTCRGWCRVVCVRAEHTPGVFFLKKGCRYTEQALSVRFINAKAFAEIWADAKSATNRMNIGCKILPVPQVYLFSLTLFLHLSSLIPLISLPLYLMCCKVHAGWYEFLTCHSSSCKYERKSERKGRNARCTPAEQERIRWQKRGGKGKIGQVKENKMSAVIQRHFVYNTVYGKKVSECNILRLNT